MRKLLYLKFFSWLLLVVILTAVTHGVCENAHASQVQPTVASEHASQSEVFASGQCPCCPLEHEENPDVCDSCINCLCHASLTIPHFRLTYNPVILDLKGSHPFRHLPDVYLPKFIPPQNLA